MHVSLCIGVIHVARSALQNEVSRLEEKALHVGPDNQKWLTPTTSKSTVAVRESEVEPAVNAKYKMSQRANVFKDVEMPSFSWHWRSWEDIKASTWFTKLNWINLAMLLAFVALAIFQARSKMVWLPQHNEKLIMSNADVSLGSSQKSRLREALSQNPQLPHPRRTA